MSRPALDGWAATDRSASRHRIGHKTPGISLSLEDVTGASAKEAPWRPRPTDVLGAWRLAVPSRLGSRVSRAALLMGTRQQRRMDQRRQLHPHSRSLRLHECRFSLVILYEGFLHSARGEAERTAYFC